MTTKITNRRPSSIKTAHVIKNPTVFTFTLLNGTARRPIELDSLLNTARLKHKSEDLRSNWQGISLEFYLRRQMIFCKIFNGDEKVFIANGNNNLVVEEDEELTMKSLEELRKKKKELQSSTNKRVCFVSCQQNNIKKFTEPIMLELYERIQAEYALYETSRRLDITDDKFVRNDLVG
uniref:Akirin n=1 Tax=Ditylenchus dipsaci TaxID=166011 RepID=A0A915D1R3_9BILA